MEQRGVKLLESVHTIQKSDSNIHFVDFEKSIMSVQKGLETINLKENQEMIQINIMMTIKNSYWKR